MKYLLCLLNSKLIYFYFKNTFSDNKITFPKVKRSQILELPYQLSENNNTFIERANNMLLLNNQFHEKKSKFLDLLMDNLEIDKISKKLATFYKFDFKMFLLELKKQKITLSLSQQSEWKDFFVQYKTEINQLQSEINKTDKEIDQMVYELYGLTEEEIKIVEESS